MQCWPEQVLAIVCATLRSLLFGDYRYCVLPAATCCYLLYRLAKNLESDLQKLNFAAMET